jgi:hypothetical protein
METKKYYKPREVFTGKLSHKDLSLIEDALEISSSVKVYGDGREKHQKECGDIIKKLYKNFYN